MAASSRSLGRNAQRDERFGIISQKSASSIWWFRNFKVILVPGVNRPPLCHVCHVEPVASCVCMVLLRQKSWCSLFFFCYLRVCSILPYFVFCTEELWGTLAWLTQKSCFPPLIIPVALPTTFPGFSCQEILFKMKAPEWYAAAQVGGAMGAHVQRGLTVLFCVVTPESLSSNS